MIYIYTLDVYNIYDLIYLVEIVAILTFCLWWMRSEPSQNQNKHYIPKRFVDIYIFIPKVHNIYRYS